MSENPSPLSVLRNIGGYFVGEQFGLIEIYGRDAKRFLQSQTTNDVNSLNECSHQVSCLLDRKAHIQAQFDLYRRHESYRILVEKTQVETVLEHLDHFRIADKVEFLDLKNTGKFFVLQGPRCRRVINAGFKGHVNPAVFKNDSADLKLWGAATHLFRKSVTGEDGYFIWVEHSAAEEFLKNFSAVASEHGLVHLDEETLESARVEAGILKFNSEFDHNNFLPETGLDQNAVSYTKGCFQGQEVLARVKNQGAPTRGIVGILFPSGQRYQFKSGTQVHVGHEEIATIKSSTYSEALDRTVAIASVKRDYRTPGKILSVTVDGGSYEAEVALLPFYQAEPLKVKARRLYERALSLYAKESDTDAQSLAVELLRESLELDPVFEDGYEALGVILSKRGHIDEAIDLMKTLVSLNADSVMAHTNLSVFYLEKDQKELAEEEKAISVSIRMRLAAMAPSASSLASKEQEEMEEAKQRMEMFSQVLEIDADDLLANYGMGSCYVALKEFKKAVPFVLKALEIKPTYTVAYPVLAKAYEATGDVPLAISTLEKGIDVAAKRGDMSPLADMQKRLAELKKAQTAVTS